MDDIKYKEPENHYALFRHDNISMISGISRNLEKKIETIIQKQNSLTSEISSMDANLEALKNIYLSFHSMHGSETLARMKSLLDYYKAISNTSEKKLSAAGYLSRKLNRIINQNNYKGLEPFRSKQTGNEKQNISADLRSNAGMNKYRWATFERNGSWFISNFSVLNYKSTSELKLLAADMKKLILKKNDSSNIEVSELLGGPRPGNKPAYILQLSESGPFIAVDQKGKEIYSSSDFISPMITKLKKSDNRIYKGRVRLFGINHLVLDIVDEQQG